MTPVETVCKHLGAPELLCQLAEEAAELAQAALKLRRVIDGTNWTPKTLVECQNALAEEIADVQGVLQALDFSAPLVDYGVVREFQTAKMGRWAKRLEAHHAND
jgi:hypothetical protein